MTSGTSEHNAAGNTAPTTDSQPIRVLIADDSFSFRSGLARLLRREPNIQVVGRACNGDHAIRLTRRVHPHVVLLDIAMRGMDGIQAAQAICAEFPSISVIGLSSYAVDSDQGKAMQKAGAVEYLCKGSDGNMGDHVIAAIRRCAENRAASPSQV